MGRPITVWKAYRPLLPNSASELPIERGRESLYAVVCGMMAGLITIPGWNYTNSVTLGEAAPGTAAQPAREYFKYGSGISTKIIRRANTYDGAGNLTKCVLTYSEDNGYSYANLTDENGNFVLNSTYDGAGNLTAATWAKA